VAKQGNPFKELAEKMYFKSLGKMPLKKIADKLGISDGTVRGWKSRGKWDERLKEILQSADEIVADNPNATTQRPINLTALQPKADEQPGLTTRHEIFIMEYLRDFNATRAAMAAGYSKKSAHVEGCRLLRHDKIQKEIKRLKALHTLELGLDIKRVIAEYMKIAFADITDVVEFGQKDVPVFDEEGNVIRDQETGEPLMMKESYVDFKNDCEIDGSVISEVRKGKAGVAIKLHDKIRALGKLERYLDYMTEEEKLRMKKMRLEIEALKDKGW
jgi:phage terminase small subunit